jgi:hypothetical protein
MKSASIRVNPWLKNFASLATWRFALTLIWIGFLINPLAKTFGVELGASKQREGGSTVN